MEVFGCLKRLFLWKGKSAIQIEYKKKIVGSLAVMLGDSSISGFVAAMLNSRLLSSKEYFLSVFRHNLMSSSGMERMKSATSEGKF